MLTPDKAKIRSFKVVPSLPKELEPLLEISKNLWWCWHPEAVELFVRIDIELWRECGHNPVKMLGTVSQHRLNELTRDQVYLSMLQRVHEKFQAHLSETGWFHQQHPEEENCCIAYFSAEFGLTESLRIYSGGLGILAGDHLKSSSELGLPLVAVGLLYRNGYFQQYLNADGWQQETYPDLDFSNLPIKPVHDEKGKRLRVHVDLRGRTVQVAVWEVYVGKIRLFLLDTNLSANEEEDRGITSHLYGGDMEMRIKQEIILGIAGVRALTALGINPTVAHLNEGHAAFSALERIRELIAKKDMTFDQARVAASAGNVFTTHTPVPAGIDRFPPELVKSYFEHYVSGLKLDMEGFLALGRENVFNKGEAFSMAVLALRTSDYANGVSKLHGVVSRDMWGSIWPDVPAEEIPIGHVTNGVHTRTWISSDLTWLYDRYLPGHWSTDPSDQSVWEGIEAIPAEELWRIHELRREHLVRWLRRTQKANLKKRGASSEEIDACDNLFSHNALTIGFARRFATYKRANLILRDPQRLIRILKNEKFPVQIVIAGKAHPADTQGKELIRQLVHFARDNGVSDRLVFIENYNMHVARYLVQGCDVWLNNPRRGKEASGTSGMKAAINGVLNLSVLDGWWDEGYETNIGWAIGQGETYDNMDYQDQVESQALYDLLEKTVVPRFYERNESNLPGSWIRSMKQCMATLTPKFNSNRQVQDYAEQYYLKAHKHHEQLCNDDYKQALALCEYRDRMIYLWNQISVGAIDADTSRPLGVGQELPISADIHLGGISAKEVRVQVYFGSVDADGRIRNAEVKDMKCVERVGDGHHRYATELAVDNSGRHGFAVRVIPGNKDLATPFIPGLITWDKEAEKVVPDAVQLDGKTDVLATTSA